jgi:hypothetical protein
MLYCFYEQPRDHSSRGFQRSSCSFCQGYSRCLDRPKDRGPSFELGGSKTGVDCGRFGFDSHESEPLGPSCKCEGFSGFKGQNSTRAASAINASDCRTGGGSFRAIPSAVWAESSPLGRPNAGGTFEASIRLKIEGPAGSELDAPVGLSLKAGRLYVSSGAKAGGHTVSPRLKKNFKIWGLGRQWSSRMRPDLRSIPGWEGDGRRGDILFASRQPASILRDLIFRVGWPRFWAGMGLSAQPEGIGKAL